MKALYPLAYIFNVVLLVFFISITILLSSCADQNTPSLLQSSSQSQSHSASTQENQPLVDACIQACKTALSAGNDLSTGPCLLDQILLDTNWVCDVAHNPRENVDDLPQNQCLAYRNRVAHNFIEVTPECGVIRVV
jgi:hypothetical protein